MKRISKIIIVTLILIMTLNIKVIAHGGNIIGWKEKDSSQITEHNGKYYGYHHQSDDIHYHQVEWNKEKKKWDIIKSAVCYDENFDIINAIDNSGTEKIKVKYNRKVDGDTAKFELNGEIITVRFLGIDTPETVHPTIGVQPYGQEASNYTKEKLENANKIEIEFEKPSQKDQHERYLAWIWVDDNLLQEELISNGLAKTYMLQDNYKYAWILQEMQEKAQENKLGIWSDETTENDKKFDVTNENHLYNGIIGLIIIVISLLISIFWGKNKQKADKE